MVSASNTAGRALANSEVKSALSLPTEHKSCSGGGERWRLATVLAGGGGVKPGAHSCRPAPGEGRRWRGGWQPGTGKAAFSSTQTGQSHGQNWAHGHRTEGSGRWGGGAGGKEAEHSKPRYP